MRSNYLGGNYGYGHAKKEFMELILTKYSQERETFDFFMNNPEEVEKRLAEGEKRAQSLAMEVLNKVRAKLGFR